MPAHRRHKTKKQQEEAVRKRNYKYYHQNRDKLLSQKRDKYNLQNTEKRKERKAENEEKKRKEWGEMVHAEHSGTSASSIQQLRDLEEQVNKHLGLGGNGSSYMERLFHEFLAYKESHISSGASPLELPNKVFSSMLDILAKIGNAILNEYGSGKEWNECKRLTQRVRYLIQCVDDFEIIVLQEMDLGEEFLKGDLMFQHSSIKAWLDRVSVRTYVRNLDMSEAPPPPIGIRPLFF